MQIAVDISFDCRGSAVTQRVSTVKLGESVQWGTVMIEAKVTYYVFYAATAAVAAMLAYQLFEMVRV